MVKTVPYGEKDLIVGFFTEQLGRVDAIALRARSHSQKRCAPLEPMHTLLVTLTQRGQTSLFRIDSARLDLVRLRLTANLTRMQAAGLVLRWVRQTTALRQPEHALWMRLQAFLDDLDAARLPASANALVVSTALGLLQCLGYGVTLDQCVVCTRPCPKDKPSYLDAQRGGLVCRQCGGATMLLTADERHRLRQAIDDPLVLQDKDLPRMLDIVQTMLRTHAHVTEPANLVR